MKKIGSNDNVYDFQIEHDTIDIKFVLNICVYLMKNHNIWNEFKDF